MKTPLYFILVSICLLWGCENEVQCPAEIDQGKIELLPSSKELFPYKDSVVNIVFRDSLNNEIIAQATQRTNGFLKIFSNSPCAHDAEVDISLTVSSETKDHFVSIPSLDIGFQVRYWVIPHFADYETEQVRDGANIFFQDSSWNGIPLFFPPQISFIIDKRNYTGIILNTATPEPVFTKLGKTFTDVYTNKNGLDKIVFHYNHDVGLLAFRLEEQGTWWVFERFE